MIPELIARGIIDPMFGAEVTPTAPARATGYIANPTGSSGSDAAPDAAQTADSAERIDPAG